uniref:Uncharacterized protein n=1 Tax=Anopheles dirus TaxID=7168 RepID=A0A182NXE4_9DIPT
MTDFMPTINGNNNWFQTTHHASI